MRGYIYASRKEVINFTTLFLLWFLCVLDIVHFEGHGVK